MCTLNTSADTKIPDSYRRSMKRRVRNHLNSMGLPALPRNVMHYLLDRMYNIAGEGINEKDLRVVVRLFRREMIGRGLMEES